MSFSQFKLDPPIQKALTLCGYEKPTPVQALSIPDILKKHDTVVSAQTGSGKTAAFVLPALHLLSTQAACKKPRILVLTPTRELATQITKAARTYGKFVRFNIVNLVGGMPYHHQIKDLARGADMIIATPGRLLDHIEQKRVDLSGINMLILDEADRMLDMGFIDDVQYIAKLTPSQRQTLLFSATLDNKIMTVVRHLLKDPVRIDLSNEKMAAPKITQEMYKATNLQHKTRLLKHFLNDKNIFKAIIFSATKINADKLAAQLRDDGFAAAALHGDLKQNVRNRTIDQLRSGKIQFLVATDVAARGIDISDITHVINYDLPKFCEDYVHRIGRTGRAGKEGTAISFVLPMDMRNLQRIERYTGQRVKLMQITELNSHGKAPTFQVEEVETQTPPRKQRESHHRDEWADKETKPRRPKKKFSASDKKPWKDGKSSADKKPWKDGASKKPWKNTKDAKDSKDNNNSNDSRGSKAAKDKDSSPFKKRFSDGSKKRRFKSDGAKGKSFTHRKKAGD